MATNIMARSQGDLLDNDKGGPFAAEHARLLKSFLSNLKSTATTTSINAQTNQLIARQLSVLRYNPKVAKIFQQDLVDQKIITHIAVLRVLGDFLAQLKMVSQHETIRRASMLFRKHRQDRRAVLLQTHLPPVPRSPPSSPGQNLRRRWNSESPGWNAKVEIVLPDHSQHWKYDGEEKKLDDCYIPSLSHCACDGSKDNDTESVSSDSATAPPKRRSLQKDDDSNASSTNSRRSRRSLESFTSHSSERLEI